MKVCLKSLAKLLLSHDPEYVKNDYLLHENNGDTAVVQVFDLNHIMRHFY